MPRAAAVLTVLIVAFGANGVSAQSPQAPGNAPDTWAPLRFLLGTWEGTSTGQPGNGSVRREYRLILRDRFIEVRNTSTYLPQEKNPKGEVHEDVGYISYDRAGKTFRFRQFHVEGFVTTYVGNTSALPAIAFNSETLENLPSGWRARETYQLIDDDSLVERFELAEPGKDFVVYSEARFRRRR